MCKKFFKSLLTKGLGTLFSRSDRGDTLNPDCAVVQKQLGINYLAQRHCSSAENAFEFTVIFFLIVSLLLFSDISAIVVDNTSGVIYNKKENVNFLFFV